MAIISRHIWRRQEARRRLMNGTARRGATGKFESLRHGQTRYQLEGSPNHPLLICIHGWSTASYVWGPLRPRLIKHGYRVLTYDLYGRGYSDRPNVEHTAELFTAQLTDLLQRLKLNGKELNLIGYSMGGAIAARFVAERLEDVNRLLLIAPAGMHVRLPRPREFARDNPKLMDPHILALLPPVLRKQFRSEAAGFKSNPDVARVVRCQLRELEFKGYLPALLSSLKGVLASEMDEEHQQIALSDVAVRALFAREDTTIPMEKAKDLFDQWNPNNVGDVISNAGHGVTYTHARQIMERVGDFL